MSPKPRKIVQSGHTECTTRSVTYLLFKSWLVLSVRETRSRILSWVVFKIKLKRLPYKNNLSFWSMSRIVAQSCRAFYPSRPVMFAHALNVLLEKPIDQTKLENSQEFKLTNSLSDFSIDKLSDREHCAVQNKVFLYMEHFGRTRWTTRSCPTVKHLWNDVMYVGHYVLVCS